MSGNTPSQLLDKIRTSFGKECVADATIEE